MKKTLLLLTVFFFAIALFAQDPIVKFYLNDGSQPKEYKIADIEEIAGADSACGIAHVSGADIGMALAFHEDDIAGTRLLLASQQAEEAVPGHLGQRLHPRSLQERWCQVHQVDEVIAHLAWLYPGRPAYG